MQARREDWIRLQRSEADNKREMAAPHFMSVDPTGAINLKHTSGDTICAHYRARAILAYCRRRRRQLQTGPGWR